MRTDSKGDIERIAEIQLKPKDVKDPTKGFSCKVATQCIDSRDPDGPLYCPPKVDRAIDVDAAIEAGVVTAEQYQAVYAFFAACYDWEPAPVEGVE